MHEFDTVSVSSFEAASLAGKLTEKSADGWDVVAIVPAGSEVTAYLRRESTDSTSTGEVAAEPAAAEAVPEAEPQEPAGWGAAPAAADTGWGSSGTTADMSTAATTEPATPAGTTSWDTGATAVTTPAATPSPQVPPGWYADPSGRYELRYWDGAAWTEHVARQGQQYTDPPVA